MGGPCRLQTFAGKAQGLEHGKGLLHAFMFLDTHKHGLGLAILGDDHGRSGVFVEGADNLRRLCLTSLMGRTAVLSCIGSLLYPN